MEGSFRLLFMKVSVLKPSLWDAAVSMMMMSVCGVCSLAIYFWEHLELRNLEHVSLGTLPGGSFCEGFEEILHYGMMRCLSV